MKLEVKQISKSFGRKQVLNNIVLQIKDGEFISLLGPSGSGKSTLFNLIGGLLPPDQGSIVMDGADITGTSGHISYMPQQPALLPWRTILGNVLLGQELYGIKETDKAVQMLEKAGLGEVAASYPHELSGGMKQRAAFIRALLSPQSLMLLDEPFSALDEFTRLDMQKWLLNIWEADRQSVLFITHSIEEALFLSDKIIILSDSPAKVKKVIDIPFPRPRKEELLLSPDFLKWKRYVTAAISEWETSKI